MKTIKLLSRSVIACLMVLLCIHSANGQKKKFADSVNLVKKIAEIKAIENDDYKIIIDSLFDQKLDSILNTVGGMTYKDGKAPSTSATVDDKGLTLNFNVIDRKWWTFQVTGSGKAEDKVIDLFSKGKYGKTLSGGVNMIVFTPWFNKAFTSGTVKKDMFTAINKISSEYQRLRDNKVGVQEIADFSALFRSHGAYLKMETKSLTPGHVQSFETDMNRLNSLITKYKDFLPTDFTTKTTAEQQTAIDQLKTDAYEVVKYTTYEKEVDSINKLQLGINFSKVRVNWMTLSVKVNNEKYPLFDANKPDDSYLTSTTDYYPSIDYSWNFLLSNGQVKTWIFPTVAYKYSKTFEKKNLRYLDIPKGTKELDGKSITEYKQISYYNSDVAKKHTFNLELPLTLYFSKKKWGLDLAVNTGLKPGWNSYGARAGIYIPLLSGAETIIIEPLVKLEDLEDRSLSFRKDKLSFGVSLTVKLPKHITGK